jgi:hypothetical protein
MDEDFVAALLPVTSGRSTKPSRYELVYVNFTYQPYPLDIDNSGLPGTL